jgi:hypothetical protein
MDTPVCDCHGELMLWHRKKQANGGTWECRIRNQEAARARYWADPNKQRQRKRDQYEKNALAQNMRAQLRHRRKRLALIRERVDGSL